jgi:2-(3-amino-3-carboxypropyl)histidine synthase
MYKLETDRLLAKIKECDAKRILIQLPDGLKPQAKKIVDIVREETGAEVFIWLGSCFGACDIPFGLQQLKMDLVIQWGHNRFNKIQSGW